jgi:hypothetical protein
MYVHISAAAIERARDVNDLSLEEAADLVEQAPQPVAIGIFPRQVVRFASDPHWVHALRGDPSRTPTIRSTPRCSRSRPPPPRSR